MRIKTCPFCRKPPIVDEFQNEWQIICKNEECVIHPSTYLYAEKIDAIKAWNLRRKDKESERI